MMAHLLRRYYCQEEYESLSYATFYDGGGCTHKVLKRSWKPGRNLVILKDMDDPHVTRKVEQHSSRSNGV